MPETRSAASSGALAGPGRGARARPPPAPLAGADGDVMGDLVDPGRYQRLATEAPGGLPDRQKRILERLLDHRLVAFHPQPQVVAQTRAIAGIEGVQRAFVARGDARDEPPVFRRRFGRHLASAVMRSPHLDRVLYAVCLYATELFNARRSSLSPCDAVHTLSAH